MFERLIERAVERFLEKRVVSPEKKIYPQGYNPLPEIKKAMFEWLYVPFNGERVLMKVRYPNYTQLLAGGFDYGRILLDAEKGRPLADDEKLQILNAEEYAAKCAMCSPAYEDFEALVCKEDYAVIMRRAKIAEIKEALKSPELTREQREAFAKELKEIEFFTGIILPSDTIAALARIALGADVSDIRKLTRAALEQAAYKAEVYGGTPHSHLSGVFTDRDAAEIDAVCFGIIAELKEKKDGPPRRPRRRPRPAGKRSGRR
jgi:hypothetical protein